jgi:CRISPR-associated exonuclease Cas4
MNSEYSVDDFLPLSGIQHYLFCRRQWALIHIEQQWQENALTAEGRIMHDRADDHFFTETRNGVITARGIPIASYRLGVVGVCDVVEFTASTDGVKLPGRDGLYLAAPIEYKRGKPKHDPCDRAQLCAQAMCLEEMLCTTIPRGYLYYGQTRHRVTIELTDELRDLVRATADEMHHIFRRDYTPCVKPSKSCRACSLTEVCLPRLQEKVLLASQYIRRHIENA